MHSDLDIVKKTLSDGNEYFEPLITRYNNYIFSIMMRLTSGNVDFSEDLTQLSFLRALKYLNSYDQKKNFKNWLISIAVNCFKSEIKKESKYILDEVNDVAVEESNTSNDFYKIIKNLNVNERVILTLKYVYDQKNEEIAQLVVFKKDEEVISLPLYAAEELKKVNFFKSLITSINFLIWGDV